MKKEKTYKSLLDIYPYASYALKEYLSNKEYKNAILQLYRLIELIHQDKLQ